MARSSAQPAIPQIESPAEERPASRSPRSRPGPAGWRTRARFALLAGMWLLAALALWLAGSRLYGFLTTHPQFALPASPAEADGGKVQIQGLRYTPRREVLEVFAGDFGRSVFLVPLAQRRRQLMAIDWVREAMVRRRWPNHLFIAIEERRPVAFALLPAARPGEPQKIALTDAEGVLLRPPARGDFSLPVLSGLSPEMPAAERRRRVALMLRLLEQAGPHSSEISEIDVSNPEDVVVIEAVQGRTVRLRVGSEDFGERLKKFHEYYPQITRRSSGPELFDLRPDGQIVQIETGAAGLAAAGLGSRNNAR